MIICDKTIANVLAYAWIVLETLPLSRAAATLDAMNAFCQAWASIYDSVAEPLRGEIADLDVLRAGAAQSDGVISLAFSRDYSDPDGLAQAVAQESAAIAALGNELIDSDRPIVTVSGTPWVPGCPSTETDPLPADGPVGGRGRSVNALLELASRGVRATAVRMPRTVHNEGKGGFADLLTDQARRTGVVGYPRDGTQRWPAVHALDAAVIFRLALESAPAGTAWHAVADQGDAGATSQQSLVGGWACQSRRYQRRPSARWARSSRWTSQRPVPTPAMHSDGSRRTAASSRTWGTFSPETVNPVPVAEPNGRPGPHPQL
jgi:hypothetical protein